MQDYFNLLWKRPAFGLIYFEFKVNGNGTKKSDADDLTIFAPNSKYEYIFQDTNSINIYGAGPQIEKKCHGFI